MVRLSLYSGVLWIPRVCMHVFRYSASMPVLTPAAIVIMCAAVSLSPSTSQPTSIVRNLEGTLNILDVTETVEFIKNFETTLQSTATFQVGYAHILHCTECLLLLLMR